MIGHRLLANTLLCMGDAAEGLSHLDRALALYDPAVHRPRHALPVKQTCLNETVERRLKFRLRLAYDPGQQCMRKLAPDRRAHLRCTRIGVRLRTISAANRLIMNG